MIGIGMPINQSRMPRMTISFWLEGFHVGGMPKLRAADNGATPISFPLRCRTSI